MWGGAACSEIGPYSDHDYGGYEDAMLAREVRANQIATIMRHTIEYHATQDTDRC